MSKTRGIKPESDKVMELFALYFDPSDFPGMYVIRRWEVTSKGARPTDAVWSYATFDQAKQSIRPSLCFIRRSPGDDPKIVGTWL